MGFKLLQRAVDLIHIHSGVVDSKVVRALIYVHNACIYALFIQGIIVHEHEGCVLRVKTLSPVDVVRVLNIKGADYLYLCGACIIVEHISDLVYRAYCQLGGFERLLSSDTLKHSVLTLSRFGHSALLYGDMVGYAAHSCDGEPRLRLACCNLHRLDIHILSRDHLFLGSTVKPQLGELLFSLFIVAADSFLLRRG